MKPCPATTTPRPLHSTCPLGKGPNLDHSALSHTASFFGENHLELLVATVLTDIDLQLQFSTSQPEALFLLAAGPTDHLLLQLYSGHLQVSDTFLLDSFSSFQWRPTSYVTLCKSFSPWSLKFSTVRWTVAPQKL